MGLFTYDPLIFGGFDLSNPAQLKIFQGQLSQYLNQVQNVVTQLVQNPSYAASTLNFKTAYLSNVTTNQSVDCVGAVSVGVGMSVNSNFSPTLTLQHLALGVPVMITFTNFFSGAVTLKINATTPSGSAQNDIDWKFSTGVIDMTATGASVGAGVIVIATGCVAPLATETLFMVAN